jgi:hypothetical protein
MGFFGVHGGDQPGFGSSNHLFWHFFFFLSDFRPLGGDRTQ